MITSGHYDYIIAGGGCAGRSLAVRLLQEPSLADKKILLVDNSVKTSNDRTWCFWEKEAGIFEDIVSCRWSKLTFKGSDGFNVLDIDPYKYKLVRGIDFYRHTSNIIADSNIEMVYGTVDQISNGDKYATAVIDNVSVSASYIFSSIPYEITMDSPRYTYLLQHFKGWVIETETAFFDPENATLMDFYSGDDDLTAFFYVLPYSNKKALIEYTVFSETLLKNEQYETALKDYILIRLGCSNYQITEIENGCIPMYDHPYKTADNRIIYLGTAGGNAKASTGYTFSYIQQHTAAIVALLAAGKLPAPVYKNKSRFRFYDSIFLRLLSGNKLTGKDIFTRLFARNPAPQILKFLDNDTSAAEEARIFLTLQKRVFAAEAFRTLFGRLF